MTEQSAVRHLTELLAAVSASADEPSAIADGAARVAAALGADLVAVVLDDHVLTRHGLPAAEVPDAAIVRAAVPTPGREGGGNGAVRDGADLEVCAVPLGDEGMVLAVAGWCDGDVPLLGDLAQGFAMALRTARATREERALREAGERHVRHNAALVASLRERSRLLERLVRIQRSISHRAPLQEVFDAITAGASDLLDVGVVGLLLEDDDPAVLRLISSFGVAEQQLAELLRTPARHGAGGRAYQEQRLVVVDDYRETPGMHALFVADGLQTAMAAPVHRQGRVVGALTVGSYDPGRRYSRHEQEALLAFAEHTSLALTDASTVAELRAAEHAKDLFLAMVSHELKTPLTVIMGTLRTLERRGPALPDDVRTALLAAAFERGRDLERLIDRLLQGARAELASERRTVRLPDLVADAVHGFEVSGRLLPGPVPDVAVALDAAAVRRVVGILLENAVAHAPDGTPIHVEARTRDDEVCIAVRNAGRLPDELDTRALFEPFQRGAGARASGVGLGLSIAARLASAAGGRIDATSGHEGVTFALHVPVEPDPSRG